MFRMTTKEFEPLLTPAGTPFLATVYGGLPQLVVRSPHLGDLEAWYHLNGAEWVRADDEDVNIIASFVPVPLIDVDECDCDCGLCDDE
ncbi:Uncharacterised protein [Corynebacterium minutissimum]|uniref:Uncharacterized protein n=2 Tax=Corynebacterium minutissimum TaxID=38301 RepID=A0A376CY72_9CORY|nr:Uncharacterised protein [Corynebacterium minutissimum]